jgi:hypothetical protein
MFYMHSSMGLLRMNNEKFRSFVSNTVKQLDVLAASPVNKSVLQNAQYVINAMQQRLDRLKTALQEEAAYCQKYEDQCRAGGDVPRAERHRERKERLLSHLNGV